MIEPYQWLVSKADELGLVKENIGPASVDLRLGDMIKVSGKVSKEGENEVQSYGFKVSEEGFTFHPRYFYLCSTVEYVKVPKTHAGFVNMRSSLARRGLGHKMAGFIDPGFEGEITLELSADIPVHVSFRERIVQIVYVRLTEESEKGYEGKYKGQVGPTEAYQGFQRLREESQNIPHSSRLME